MSAPITSYLSKIQTELATGNALEHTYRPALKTLIEELNENVNAVNEPARSEHGAPDFIFLDKNNRELILGYGETKDLDVDLNKTEETDQLKRYLGYPNLILTNYTEFRFFRNGEKYQTITIAEKKFGVIYPVELNFSALEREIKAFLNGKPEQIKSASKLARVMGGKASRIRDNVKRYISSSHDDRNDELFRIYQVVKTLLVHDLQPEAFADMYAQTLVYGLFVARYYDNSPDTFSRQEARDLVPASNPFLREFFDHIAGSKFDTRLRYITDELCDVFSVSDVRFIMQKHFNLLGEAVDKDPIIHFYEDFLKEYDPLLKKQMGAYYTPVPAVNFIIRSVDEVLKRDFGLSAGLADTSKISYTTQIQSSKQKVTVPRVQILDPAVGTATFLNEIIKFLYVKFTNQKGMWSSFVEQELLPRLHGFELMMAPYTVAHLKLALTLKETGIDNFKQRLGVYLTNTLEEGMETNPGLFSDLGLVGAITSESQEASRIKHQTPIMVVVGNPPYSGESFNKGEFAMRSVDKYKFEPGGKVKLQERNPKWLNDDYVKFIGFASDLIEKNSEGIVAMITNHGYLDNPTFRGMRWQLANTFSKLYVLDLHGNAKKKEISPDGSPDKNVFDIQQGVSIIIAVKKKSTSHKLASVYRSDLWGSRTDKFNALNANSLGSIKWDQINLREPGYLFLNKDEKMQAEYEQGIKLNELFPVNNVGIVTGRDSFVIDESKAALYARIASFCMSDPNDPKLADSVKQSDKFQYKKAIELGFDEKNIKPISYRPFDNRYIYYADYYIERARKDVMQHFRDNENIGIMLCRQQKTEGFHHALVHKDIVESSYVSNKTSEIGSTFPLYLYSDQENQKLDATIRTPNLNIKLVKKLFENVQDYQWSDQRSPEEALDYIYASLHSPNYRGKYKDFLKSDFPCIPRAKDTASFLRLVALGGQLRRLHFLEEKELGESAVTFPVVGSNEVKKIEYKEEKVYLNPTQYFDKVSKEAWEFCIGGYQPAQKWLKDRKEKILSYDEIKHYQQIITAQTKTIDIMKKIDEV